MTVLILLLGAGLAGWILLFLWLVRNAAGHPNVSANVSAAMQFPLRESPSVTVVIPARNEARILGVTLPSILEQEYGNYEVILVDDASEDGTGRLAEELAAKHADRLRVIRVAELPTGWVGKTHALHTGFEAARGEWVLATDADILFHPKALRAGLWLAEQHQAEMVSIYAFLDCVSFWEKVMLPGFALLLSASFPIRKINDPADPMALASGGYILMRRSTWAGLGGYAAIRSEMIDDLNTARRIKRAGNRIYVSATRNLLRTRMYYNFRGIWEGLRKNAFAGHGFSIPKIAATICVYSLGNVLPVACLLFYLPRWIHGARGAALASVLLLSLAQYGISVAMHLPLLRFLRIPLRYALLAPLGAILYAAICADSMARTLMGSGVSWKRRQYGRP